MCVGFLSLNGEMEKLIHLPLCRFVPNKRTEGPLEGHRGFAVLPFLHLEFVRNLRVDVVSLTSTERSLGDIGISLSQV